MSCKRGLLVCFYQRTHSVESVAGYHSLQTGNLYIYLPYKEVVVLKLEEFGPFHD